MVVTTTTTTAAVVEAVGRHCCDTVVSISLEKRPMDTSKPSPECDQQ
jgi:hypothetical protein